MLAELTRCIDDESYDDETDHDTHSERYALLLPRVYAGLCGVGVNGLQSTASSE
jgi:hypothetical protein